MNNIVTTYKENRMVTLSSSEQYENDEHIVKMPEKIMSSIPTIPKREKGTLTLAPRLMRIKLRSYEPSSTMLSCSRLICSVRTKKLISNGVEEGKRPRRLKKQKKKQIYEYIAGLLSVRGPIPLPTRRRKYCLLKSPHVNKTSRDHYEINIHKRLLYVEFCDKNVLDSLRNVDILPGVQVDIVYD